MGLTPKQQQMIDDYSRLRQQHRDELERADREWPHDFSNADDLADDLGDLAQQIVDQILLGEEPGAFYDGLPA